MNIFFNILIFLFIIFIFTLGYAKAYQVSKTKKLREIQDLIQIAYNRGYLQAIEDTEAGLNIKEQAVNNHNRFMLGQILPDAERFFLIREKMKKILIVLLSLIFLVGCQGQPSQPNAINTRSQLLNELLVPCPEEYQSEENGTNDPNVLYAKFIVTLAEAILSDQVTVEPNSDWAKWKEETLVARAKKQAEENTYLFTPILNIADDDNDYWQQQIYWQNEEILSQLQQQRLSSYNNYDYQQQQIIWQNQEIQRQLEWQQMQSFQRQAQDNFWRLQQQNRNTFNQLPNGAYNWTDGRGNRHGHIPLKSGKNIDW